MFEFNSIFTTISRFFNRSPFLVFLFFYHLLYGVLAYCYFTAHGGDTQIYWFLDSSAEISTWISYFDYGTSFIQFLNYPFAVSFSLPLWFGFLIYNLIGFLGLRLLYLYASQLITGMPSFLGLTPLHCFFLLPNLHFWTSLLGKEPLVFLVLVVLLRALPNFFRHWSACLAFVVLLLIRPHVAFLFLVAYFVCSVFFRPFRLTPQTILYLVFGLVFISFSFYLTLELTQIRHLNFQRIQDFNTFSILSFQRAQSYVPVLEYTWFERIFAFLYRPFFFDVTHLYSFFLSVEHLILLVLTLYALTQYFFCNPRFVFSFTEKFIFVFALLSIFVFLQRYACLGIFVRTKIMFMPFVYLVFIRLCFSNRKLSHL